MTNLEWLKKRINEMSAEEFGTAWGDEVSPWCDGNKCRDTEGNCVECVRRWATKPHENPMPELKVGMFVKATNEFETSLGIIINNIYDDNLAIAYESGGYDSIRTIIIEAVYNTVGFRFCDDNTCIWRRN